MKHKIDGKYQCVVHYPAQFETERYAGALRGYYHEESNEYNIVNYGAGDAKDIGILLPQKPEVFSEDGLTGFWDGDELFFCQGETGCQKKPYELVMNIFSRNTGILETSQMLGKRAAIAGLGSVGSLVALELARAGVGNFLLIDNDALAYHNICRHQLGVADVGRFKVSAVKEKILQINPGAKVETETKTIEYVEKRVFDGFFTSPDDSILVGGADNREADIYANKISKIYEVPFVTIGLWERAFAGEIFYTIPGENPCYECVFGQMALSGRTSQNHRFYMDQEALEDSRFEPGISVDINFVTEIGIKLIIDILNRKDESYRPKVYHYLKQYTLICNTNDIKTGGERAAIFAYPLQVTNSLKINYSDACSHKCKDGKGA